ncbi:MAG: tRNA-(ms[2]io[6]A)-hydroxylase [Cyclobacteriaceae bacterium]
MLGLKLPTDPRWVNIVEKKIIEILQDHAYCEQKAAASCIHLIVSNPERIELVNTLTPIVAEEWGHFRMVLAELSKRGASLGRTRVDEYVAKLLKFCKKGFGAEFRLMDNLLMSALIEARSCERFRLLSLEINDESLKNFYHELMVSEAGHYRTFLDLAHLYSPEEKVKQRWKEWLAFEEEMLPELELRGDRVH